VERRDRSGEVERGGRLVAGHLTAFAEQPVHGSGRRVIESSDAANALREWLVRHAVPF
jgi:hypothetical protein